MKANAIQQAAATATTYDADQAGDWREWTLPQVLEHLNARHAVIGYGNRILIMSKTFDPMMHREQLTFLSRSDFSLMYANRLLNVGDAKKPIWASWAKVWIESPDRKQYRGLAFLPEGDPRGFYNLWCGFSVKPRKGICSQFKAHMREVICAGDQGKFDYLWRWCAHLVQRPAELPETAIVLRGRQGAGKNTFADAIGKLLGRHYIALTHTGQVCGRFNAHLMDAVLVFANEAVWGGDKQGEGSLKAMITDPVTTIEGKHKDAVQFPNYKRIIAASNERWAVPRGIDDRRFFCLDVSAAHVRDTAYFEAIHAELKDGGLEALLFELQQTDITQWHPRNSMPSNNTDGEDMKLESMSSVLKFWLHCLISETNHPPPTMESPYPTGWATDVVKVDLYNHYLGWCDRHKINHRANEIHFSRDLTEAVVFSTKRPDAETPTYKRRRCYVFPDLETAQRQFQERIARIDFDDGAETVI